MAKRRTIGNAEWVRRVMIQASRGLEGGHEGEAEPLVFPACVRALTYWRNATEPRERSCIRLCYSTLAGFPQPGVSWSSGPWLWSADQEGSRGPSVTSCGCQPTCLAVDAGGRSVLEEDAASPMRPLACNASAELPPCWKQQRFRLKALNNHVTQPPANRQRKKKKSLFSLAEEGR